MLSGFAAGNVTLAARVNALKIGSKVSLGERFNGVVLALNATRHALKPK